MGCIARVGYLVGILGGGIPPCSPLFWEAKRGLSAPFLLFWEAKRGLSAPFYGPGRLITDQQ